MKERPILFSTPMVQAILDGRKTQTRRIMSVRDLDHLRDGDHLEHCRFGQPGDQLWVRETWAVQRELDNRPIKDYSKWATWYKDGAFLHFGNGGSGFCTDGELRGKWRPSIHMPRWASRIDLKIVSVRAERLQDISEEDCIAEGLHSVGHIDVRSCFSFVWDRINGQGSWDANHWVWRIEFEKVRP